MTTESLTYKELALRLGVKIESARKMVQRKRWHRVTGNDGIVRIQVPIEALPVPADSTPDSTPDSPSLTIRELQAKVEGLQELLSVERKRADAVELDRDRWHAMATRPWWKRLAG